MGLRRMMFFSLGAKIKNLIQVFKEIVLGDKAQFEAETCLETQLTQLDNQGVLDSASLIVTPNGYKETLLYSFKPSEVGTNLFLRSEEFDNSYWNKTRCTVVSNAQTAPNGLQTADYVVEDNTTGLRYIGKITEPTTIGQTWTFSFFCKKVDRSVIGFQANENNAIFPTARFNFDTQTFIQIPIGMSYSFEVYPNNWFRLIFTRTPTQGTSTTFGIYPTDASGNLSGVGDGISRTLIWGAQLVPSSTVTNYIPTTDRQIINRTIGDMTVTRGVRATRVNSDGLIEQVPYNIFLRSEELENAAWTKTNVSVIQNTQNSPINDLTADTLRIGVDASSVRHRFLQQPVVSPNTTYTTSYYLKKANHRWIQLNYVLGDFGSGGISSWANFDLENGVIGNTGAGAIATIEAVGNGWYRCAVQGTSLLGGSSTGCEIVTTNNTNSARYLSYQSTVAEDVCYMWGAQMVLGTEAKTYLPVSTGFNIPRIDYSNGSCPSILIEPSSANQIRNNTMAGAVVGNPGTLPTNWLESLAGLTRQVVGLGVEKGIQYVDVRYSGTATGVNTRVIFESLTQIAAATGQTWTLSTYLKLIATPQPPTGIELLIFELTLTGGYITSGSQTITPTTSFARYSFTRTLNGGATVARVQPIVNFSIVSGQTYDFTVRIYGPQMEQLSIATSLIQTTTGMVTRNADVITTTNASTLIGQTEGSVYLELLLANLNPSGRVFITLYLNTTNWVRFRIQTETLSNINIQTEWYVNSVFVNQGNANIPRSTSLNKILFTYKIGSQVNFFHNGIKLTSTNPVITQIPAFTTIDLGHRGGFSQINEGIKLACIFKTALTDTQAINLTTL